MTAIFCIGDHIYAVVHMYDKHRNEIFNIDEAVAIVVIDDYGNPQAVDPDIGELRRLH